MSFWRKPFSSRRQVEVDDHVSDDASELVDGDLHYVIGKAGNNSQPSYQEASGAPVEQSSPLGYSVGPITIVFLNVSKMIGTGVFSTPSSILTGTGSIGLSLIWWSLGFLTSITAFSVYLEFASYFPNRSGAEVVYLEQAFPRPRWLFPTMFAFQSVVLSFSSANSIVLAQYVFKMSTHTPTSWELKGVAIAGYTIAVIFVALHTRFSYLVVNGVGIVKVGTLLFISITGFIVLGGGTRVENPTVNFHNAFEGAATAYGTTNALYKIIFSYAGFENAFNVVNEVKNPIKQIRRNGFIALCMVTVLYIFTIIAYYSAVPKADIMAGKQTVANLFFVNVFGHSGSIRGLNFLIVLSSFGNLLAVLLGTSRIIRECGRQGVLPFPRFWASTKPFGTTLGPYLFTWAVTTIMIVGPPAGDAFNFVADLRIYPASFFDFLMVVGLVVVRRKRKQLNLPRPTFKAWDVVVYFGILKNLFLLVMPWYPPAGGSHKGDVSFWYATYIVASIGIISACVVYYWVWIHLLPKLGGYEVKQEVLLLDDGAQSHKLVKVPVSEVERWNATHDSSGRLKLDTTIVDTGRQYSTGPEDGSGSENGKPHLG